MTRTLTVLAALLGLAPLARAQDMPLSQILIDGEGWKKVEGQPEKPKGIGKLAVLSPDGGTQFTIPQETARTIRAHQVEIDGTVGRGSPYCHLRTKWGARGVFVSGLAVDKDGRVYAATEIGVQVFDPTGRLCGVLSSPITDDITNLAFEGDHLTLWIGDAKYTRKLNATGVK